MSSQQPRKLKRLSLYDETNVVGLHAEAVYDPVTLKSRWAVFNKSTGQISYVNQIKWPADNETYFPEDGGVGGLLEKKTILLPSEAVDFGSEESLVDEIQGYIRTYMALPEEFYLLSAHYVLLTWLGDCFPALPYLRARGDTGTGKSRFLKAIGSLCYTPIFASGATTASPIFRIYEIYRRATFLFDEADWDTQNDEFGEVIKILNFGYEKGAAVLRSAKEGNDVEPRAYDVFGPKLLATRNVFKDSALESRCFTAGLRVEKDLSQIPENIGLSFWNQARDLRNKLLTWRFHRFHVHHEIPGLDLSEIHPRLRMIMTPMIMTREGNESRSELIAYLRTLNTDVQERRALDLEAVILESLLNCIQDQAGLIESQTVNITLNDMMAKLNAEREAEGETEKISVRKIHSVLKTRLNIVVKRVGAKFCVVEDLDYIRRVASQFGIGDGAHGDSRVATEPSEEAHPASHEPQAASHPQQGEFLEEPEEPEE